MGVRYPGGGRGLATPSSPSSFHLCVCAQSLSRVQLFATPWPIARLGFPRREYWSGLPLPTLGDLPDSGIKPKSPASPAPSGAFFAAVPSGEPKGTAEREAVFHPFCGRVRKVGRINAWPSASASLGCPPVSSSCVLGPVSSIFWGWQTEEETWEKPSLRDALALGVSRSARVLPGSGPEHCRSSTLPCVTGVY